MKAAYLWLGPALGLVLVHCTTEPSATPDRLDAGATPSPSSNPPTDLDAAADASSDAAAPLPGRAGDACSLDADCEETLRCREGQCARVVTGDHGRSCETATECAGGVCLTLGDGRKVCSSPCSDPAACGPGWACESDAGAAAICTCTPSEELCNGADDDCDGIIDNPSESHLSCLALNPNYHCLDEGVCGCRPENLCDGVCVADTRSNVEHCGTCGTVCPRFATCGGGACLCPDTRATVCGAECVDVRTDRRSCGACDHACAAGVSCGAAVCRGATTVAVGGMGVCVTYADGAVACSTSIGTQLTTNPGLQGGKPVLGDAHACAVMADGTVRCWGTNYAGQCGSPSDAGGPESREVSGLPPARSVAVGGEHTCALLLDGTVSCWGEGGLGQLGTPSPTGSTVFSRHTPALVPGVTGAISVAAGGRTTCALIQDGTVRCWGESAPNPNPAHLEVPKDIGLTGVRAVGLGRQHGCVLMNDGTVRCWGWGLNGELGNGDDSVPANEAVWTPAPVQGLSGVVALAVRPATSCALLGDGTVRCWGAGPLGVGDTAGRSVPTAVLGLTGATALPQSGTRCAILGGGSVSCWGATPTTLDVTPF